MHHLALALALATLAAGGRAQKLALSDGSDRQVVVLDVAPLLPDARNLLTWLPEADRPAAVAASLQQLAAFVRATVPELQRDGADLQTLGGHHLVVLGHAPQVAAAEQWLARARAACAAQFQVDVRWCVVSATTFATHIAPRLPAAAGDGPCSTVVDTATATTMLRGLRQDATASITQFPQIVAPALHRALLRVGKDITYVRDHELAAGPDGLVARPLAATIFAGHEVTAMVAPAANGLVAMQIALVDHVVEQPLHEVVTTIPGSTMEVRVQVPRVTGSRASQVVEMADGATALVAARQNDGRWLVLLTTVYEIQAEGTPVRPR